MLDTIQNLTADLPLDTAAKRALIESELRKDADRSDREIARIVGCDHKTVGAARERLGIASPLGNSPPSPTERRQMLIAGVEDFDSHVKQQTAEGVVDVAIAKGVVSLAPEDENDMCWCIPHQARIECSLMDDGDLEIRQEGQNGPDEDDRIHVAQRNVVALARRILWAAGFKSIGIYAYVKGGCADLEDGDTPDRVSAEMLGYGPVR